MSLIRLAVVVSHPIQYYSPWFQRLASWPGLILKVFYLWDFGVQSKRDRGFGRSFVWDIPLLEGYEYLILDNVASDPGTHHFSGLNNPSLVVELLSWRPDAVMLFGYVYCSHLRLLLDPRARRVPILFRGDSHLLAPRSGVKPLISNLIRQLLFRRFAAGLPVGKANAYWMQRSGIPVHRQFFSPHAVDNRRFQDAAPKAERSAQFLRYQLGISASASVVLFAGKFESDKCPLDLMESFKALQHPSAVLVFVGNGALEEELKANAALAEQGRIVFLGFQNQSVMPTIYALADLIVLPSLSETWGLCINEAMNMARPVVVSSHVGCAHDLVIPGQTGWIFPAGEQDALRSALSDALSNPARLKTMGLAARARIDCYSYSEASLGLMEALRTVMPQP